MCDGHNDIELIIHAIMRHLGSEQIATWCHTLLSLLYLFFIWRRFLFGKSVAIRVKSEPNVASACDAQKRTSYYKKMLVMSVS